jgi:hypothetical protein
MVLGKEISAEVPFRVGVQATDADGFFDGCDVISRYGT